MLILLLFLSIVFMLKYSSIYAASALSKGKEQCSRASSGAKVARSS